MAEQPLPTQSIRAPGSCQFQAPDFCRIAHVESERQRGLHPRIALVLGDSSLVYKPSSRAIKPF
jgi:hypothetical protein